MTISDSALNGIHQAEARLEQTATKVAKLTDLQGPDVVSLSDDAVALIEANVAVAANVRAFHAADDMQKTLLNLLG